MSQIDPASKQVVDRIIVNWQLLNDVSTGDIFGEKGE